MNSSKLSLNMATKKVWHHYEIYYDGRIYSHLKKNWMTPHRSVQNKVFYNLYPAFGNRVHVYLSKYQLQKYWTNLEQYLDDKLYDKYGNL